MVNLVEITADGNCFYRGISYLLLGDENYFENIKELIIHWIENNYQQYVSFFSDDDKKKFQKKIFQKMNIYILKKNSWGSYYTFEIACLIFNLSIAVLIDDGFNS